MIKVGGNMSEFVMDCVQKHNLNSSAFVGFIIRNVY